VVCRVALAPFAFAIVLCTSAHAQQAPRAASRSTVLVHLDGDDDATLQVNVDNEWVTYCKAPCNERVGADALFRVSGSGLRNSSPFTLRADPGASETVHVDSTSSGAHVFGASLVVLGSLGVLTGVVLDFLGVQAEKCSSTTNIEPDGTDAPSSCEKPWHNLVGIGVGVGIASIVVLAGGVALMIANGHSTVSQSASRSPHPTIAIFGFGAPPRTARAALTPQVEHGRSLVPVIATTPILSVSF
jgi:hypothetical protein